MEQDQHRIFILIKGECQCLTLSQDNNCDEDESAGISLFLYYKNLNRCKKYIAIRHMDDAVVITRRV